MQNSVLINHGALNSSHVALFIIILLSKIIASNIRKLFAMIFLKYIICKCYRKRHYDNMFIVFYNGFEILIYYVCIINISFSSTYESFYL